MAADEHSSPTPNTGDHAAGGQPSVDVQALLYQRMLRKISAEVNALAAMHALGGVVSTATETIQTVSGDLNWKSATDVIDK